jgi:hypothetical protein
MLYLGLSNDYVIEGGSLNFVDGVATVTGADTIADANFFNNGSIDLQVTVQVGDADLLTLVSNLVNINGASASSPDSSSSATPEPASMALLGSGLGRLFSGAAKQSAASCRSSSKATTAPSVTG